MWCVCLACMMHKYHIFFKCWINNDVFFSTFCMLSFIHPIKTNVFVLVKVITAVFEIIRHPKLSALFNCMIRKKELLQVKYPIVHHFFFRHSVYVIMFFERVFWSNNKYFSWEGAFLCHIKLSYQVFNILKILTWIFNVIKNSWEVSYF